MTVTDFGENWNKYDDLIKAHCATQGVNWLWLKGIMMIESALGRDPRVARGIECPDDVEGSKSEDGLSWGLLQLRPETAKDFDAVATPQKLNDPDYTVSIGAKLLRRLYRAEGGVKEFVIKAWNEGQGAATKEAAGLTPGSANDYWAKYQLAEQAIVASGQS